MATLKKGDHVSWNTSHGKTSGEVMGKVSGTAKVKGHVAKASKDNPEYKVKSSTSGKQAIHKAGSLKKMS